MMMVCRWVWQDWVPDYGMWVECVPFKARPWKACHGCSSKSFLHFYSWRWRWLVTWKPLVHNGRASISMSPWMTAWSRAPTNQPGIWILSSYMSSSWSSSSLCHCILEFYLLEKPTLGCVCGLLLHFKIWK